MGAFNRFYLSAVALPVLAFGLTMPAAAEPVPRSGAAAGAVIARKVGEEVRFINVSDWQTVDLKQDLLSGDILRTNETGQLAIVFSDRTQIRLGRNSSLVVKQVTSSTDADTVLQLQSGTIWARAERGGPGVKVETPAAAAAIRGTDWTMTVNGARTSLNVLEGVVQLSNPQGSVEVRQGEGAVASIGQIPRKIAIVDSDDREQMLFYLAPRNAFAFMSASPLPVAEMRRQADRIAAISPANRSVEDTLVLAETQLPLEGRAKARDTLKQLEGKTLSSSQRGRFDLIRAILAASEKRYDEAAKLFQAAVPELDAKRKSIAAYGGYYSRSLGNPTRVEQPPATYESSYGALLKAYTVGFLKDIPAAIEVIRDAERRYPNDPTLPAYRAQFAMLLNDRKQIEEAIAKSLAIDPSEPTALEARSDYRSDIKSDLDGALADLEAAARVAPGSTTIWNKIGNVYSARGDDKRAEEALKKSIELDPEDPVAYSNLASIYLGQDRVTEAKAVIDKALEADPGFDIALVDRGSYNMKMGKDDEAISDLLAGTVANPAYSAGQTLLGIAHYQKGDRVAATQAFDNADRLDDNDPSISAMRANIAIDQYDSESAIRNAQEFVRRGRARGGEYSSLAANQAAGSVLNYAYRFQGLNAWGEYYSDAVFDPFSGLSYLDQSIRGSAKPFFNSFLYGSENIANAPNDQAFSAYLQALMLEPDLAASRSLGTDLVSRPYIESSLGGGFTTAGGRVGYTSEASIQGYTNLPFTISFSGSLEWLQAPDSRGVTSIAALSDINNDVEALGGSAYLTARPSPYDRFALYFARTRSDVGYDLTGIRDVRNLFVGPPAFPVFASVKYDEWQTGHVTNGGIGWSHTLGYHSFINAALLYNGVDSRSSAISMADLGAFGFRIVDRRDEEYEQKTYVAAVNHTVETGSVTWRYGIEGGWIDGSTKLSFYDLLSTPVIPPTTASASTRVGLGRAYVDLLHEITPDLKAEYALFGTILSGDGTDVQRLDPRIGVSWSPTIGQLLRAGFVRSSVDTSTPTLSPIGVVGLQPNDISTADDGYTDTIALRWDAEWTPDFFTALEYQRQDVRDLSLTIPLAAAPASVSDSLIERASLSSSLLLGHGFGLSSTLAYTRSDNNDPTTPAFGRELPYIPEWAGQVALTWVNQANVKTTLAANYVGERLSSDGTRLDEYWTLDAGLTWEPFDKRFEVELNAYNLLDEKIQVDAQAPGWGRSFKGSIKVRF